MSYLEFQFTFLLFVLFIYFDSIEGVNILKKIHGWKGVMIVLFMATTVIGISSLICYLGNWIVSGLSYPLKLVIYLPFVILAVAFSAHLLHKIVTRMIGDTIDHRQKGGK